MNSFAGVKAVASRTEVAVSAVVARREATETDVETDDFGTTEVKCLFESIVDPTKEEKHSNANDTKKICQHQVRTLNATQRRRNCSLSLTNVDNIGSFRSFHVSVS